jgi:hypothetical protein
LTVRVSEIVHLPLRVLETLFDAGHDDPFLPIIRSIRDVFVFDQAVLLEEAGDGWQCAAALPHELSSLRWLPGPSFDQVAAGRIWATCASHELQEWKEASHVLVAPAQPALCLPMRVHTRRGLLILLRMPGKNAFDDADVALARQFALIALAALAARGARKMESELKVLRGQVDDLARRAYTDELTGLANRAMIQERVEDILRAGAKQSFALAFIDLDNFKHINDYYNHAVGDALLVIPSLTSYWPRQ